MDASIFFSVLTCLAALSCLLWIVRRDQISLGLPIAYLALLLLNHIPGAYAQLAGGGSLLGGPEVTLGIRYTAIGSVCFVAGVWLARVTAPPVTPTRGGLDRRRFWLFCLFGGWFLVYGAVPIGQIPSLAAALDKGGAIWVLGGALGLRAAFQSRDPVGIAIWLAALLVYPVLTLLIGGFLSYGTATLIIAGSILAVSIRRSWKVVAAFAVVAIFSMTVFVNYFESRDAIRAKVWGGATLADRVSTVVGVVEGFHWFDPHNPDDLSALDQRLNQNYFVGLAAERIQGGSVQSLNGRSVRDGLISMVPRLVWPDKPVFGGSPAVVAEMTGLQLDENTSFGVGNVMEFYINFGLIGLVAGFLGLGWLLGTLDVRAAAAERRGDFVRLLLFFLPAAALIQPLGSIVELASGGAAALVAGFGWRWAWRRWGLKAAARPRSVLGAGGAPSAGIGPVDGVSQT